MSDESVTEKPVAVVTSKYGGERPRILVVGCGSMHRLSAAIAQRIAESNALSVEFIDEVPDREIHTDHFRIFPAVQLAPPAIQDVPRCSRTYPTRMNKHNDRHAYRKGRR